MSGMELLASDSDDIMMLLSASDLSICVNLGAFGTGLSSRTVMLVPWFCELVINQQFSFASMCVPLDLTWISWCLVNLMSFAPVPFLWTDWLSMDKLMFGESDVIALRHSCSFPVSLRKKDNVSELWRESNVVLFTPFEKCDTVDWAGCVSLPLH